MGKFRGLSCSGLLDMTIETHGEPRWLSMILSPPKEEPLLRLFELRRRRRQNRKNRRPKEIAAAAAPATVTPAIWGFVRTGLGAGVAEDDAGAAVECTDDAGGCVEAEVDVDVIGRGITGEQLPEETEDEDEVTEGVRVVVAIAVVAFVGEDIEED